MISERLFSCQHRDTITAVEYSVQISVVDVDKRYAHLYIKNSQGETRFSALISKVQLRELSSLLNAAMEYLDS